MGFDLLANVPAPNGQLRFMGQRYLPDSEILQRLSIPGWKRPFPSGLDVMAVRYSVELCGITQVALMLLDVLSGLDHVKICTGYKYRGAALDYFRADMDTLAEVEPVYETLPAWRGNISGCRRFEELPKEAQTYVKRVEQLIGAPIKMVSVGPERTATLIR